MEVENSQLAASPMQDTPISQGVAGGDLTSQSQTPAYALNDEVRVVDSTGAEMIGVVVEEENADGDVLVEVGGRVLPIQREALDAMQEPKGDGGNSHLGGENSQLGGENSQLTPQNASSEVEPVGVGFFGNIYNQFKGKVKDAIDFLLRNKEGEAVGALHHKDIGEISVVYGNDGYGLAHIAKKHPEVLNDLQGTIDGMEVTSQSDNRIVLESPTHRAVISKMLGNEPTSNWLLTAYEKKNPASASSSDIETEPEGKQNGTATLQNEISRGEDSENNSDMQEGGVDKVSEDANDTKESQTAASPLGAIEVDAKGEPMYEGASVEATIADIYNDPDLDEEEADAFVQAKIDGATKRIAQLEKKKPKMGESKVAFKEAKAKWRERLESEQASLAYWQGVQAAVPEMRRKERARQQMEEEIAQREQERQKRAEQSRRAEERGRNRGDYRKAIAGWDDAPGSFHEYVAQALLVGDHKMRWRDNGSTRGLGSHTTGRRGVNRRGDVVTARNDEARAMSWLIDDRGGMSPEALADRLWNDYTGSYGEEMGEGSALDVLLDVVTSMPTPQSMWDYVKGEHDARMEAERGGSEQQYAEEEMEAMERDAMYRERYGVSEEEYWAREAEWDEFIESRQMRAEELENYDNFVAEERIKEEHERRNQENAEDEQRTDNSESEGGVEVLPGTQPDIPRGDEDVAGESEGVDGNGVESNDFASEETAELSEEDRQAIEKMPIPMLRRQIKETATALFEVSQLSGQWQEENKDNIERAKLVIAYAKEELARKERLKKSNKWGVKVGNTATPFEVVRKMFEEFNSNEDIAQLFEKVAEVFETLPIKVVFSDTIGTKGTQGWFSPTTGTMKLPGYFVYGGGISEQNKAETMLHEMIHAVTTYALYINEKPYLQTELGFRLSDDMHAAIRQLKRIYASIASDKDFKGEYGAVSVHEMIAELSNVQFREKLKKKGLWETIVDAIKRLFGITPSNALEGAEAALEYMLNNFDRSQWDKMVGMGEKRGKQMRIGVDKQIIGEKGASALDKAEEATHRMDNLGVARDMEAEGKDAKAIRMATGWERGADGKWRYEIEDFDVLLPSRKAVIDAYNEAVKEERKAQDKWEVQAYGNSQLPRASKKNTQEKNDAIRKQRKEANKEEKARLALLTKIRDYRLKLENQLRDGLNHKLMDIIAPDSEIFKSYPQLRDITITIAPSGRYLGTNGYRGSFEVMSNSMFLDWNMSEEEMKSVLLHEVQHAIQYIEGFSIGSNIERFADLRNAVVDSINFMTNGGLLNGSAISNSQSLRDALNKKIPYTNISLKDGYIDNLQKVARKYGYDNIDALVDDFENMPSAFEQYHRTAGEVESRNVQSRIGMTPKRRRATLLSETEDVAREDQIFLIENSGESAMVSEDIDINPLLNAVKTLYEKGKEFASKLFQRTYFDVARTPDFMKRLGLRGDKFTVKYGVIARHVGKDSSHDLSERDWKQLPQALQTPFAITKLKDKKDSYRIYTTLQTERGEYVVVGVDVKNAGRELEVNAVSTAFGRRNNANLPLNEEVIYTDTNITPNQSALLERPNFAQYPTNQELSTDKGSDNVGDVQEEGLMFRDGEGAMSDSDVSVANDPVAKVMGRSQRSGKQQAKRAERERKAMRNRVVELAEKMRLDNVEVVDNSQFTIKDSQLKVGNSQLSERKARAKGWFDTKTGRIVINLSNHLSVADVERTLLHEAVAHYGLRELFGQRFDTFLDNVFRNAEADVRAQIVELAKKHGWEFIDDTILAALGGKITRDLPPSLAQKVRTATEEYLAGLAEDTNFEVLEHNWSWWQQIKQFFMDMLESIGWDYRGPELSDNELRYLLWRSYENMVNPGRHRSILGMAEDVAKRHELGVGVGNSQLEIGNSQGELSQVAESDEMYSDRELREKQQEESRRQVAKVNELLTALKEAGHNGFHISRSVTDWGVSTYLQGDAGTVYAGIKYRISDHSVTSPRRVLEERMIDYSTSANDIVEEVTKIKESREQADAILAQNEKAKEEKHKLLDEKWERIKHHFDGLGFYTNERTYQNFDTFASDTSRSNILQTELGGGAFRYEYSAPKNGYQKTKPSYDYIEAFDEENAEVTTTRFKTDESIGEIRDEAGVVSYDEKYGTELGDWLKFVVSGEIDKNKTQFHIAKSGAVLNKYGIKGDINVSRKAINPKRHTQNADHGLGVQEWIDVVDTINDPLAITRYKGKPNSYRIYTMARVNGKNICVGVDVNTSNGVEITKISTAFGRDIAKIVQSSTEEELYNKDKAAKQISGSDNSHLYAEQPSEGKGTINLRNAHELGEKIAAAESEVNTNPTDKQKEAGNYKKGHVKVGSFNITIEQPKGSVRRGVDADGNKWETEMRNTYGYIRGTEGVDGDHIDVFMSDDIDGWNGRQVYVVDQRNADGSFDEHKVMLGFNDINEAEAAYMSNYKEGWQGLGAITGVSIEDFEKWIASSHRKTKAFVEYKSVKTAEGGDMYRDGETDGADENAVAAYKEQFSGAKELDIVLLNSEEEAIEFAMNEGESLETAKAGVKSVKERGVGGGFEPNTNKVIIFAFAPNNNYTTLFHEHTHYAVSKLGGAKRIKALTDELTELDPQMERKIKAKYSEAERAEEMIAHSLEAALYGGAIEDLKGALTPKARWQLEQILDIIGYEKGRDYKQEVERYEPDPTSEQFRKRQTRTRRRIAERGGRIGLGGEARRRKEGFPGVVERNTRAEAGEGRSRQEEVGDEGDIRFRDGDNASVDLSGRDRAIARDAYDRMMSSGRYQFTEAMQDSMMGLKLLYRSILGDKMEVEGIPDFENAYVAENLMSSQNAAQQREYYVKYMKPLLKAVHVLAGSGAAQREELTDYMMAKHGLERNVVMAEREAKRAADEAVKEIQNSLDKELNKYKKANELFNQQLQDFESNSHEGNLVLGEPSPILEACGIDVSSVFITPKTLKAHLDKHGLAINDIKDLPKALLSPLMVYEWGTTAKSMIVITHIPRGEQRITIAIKLERGGKRVEVNEIASIHGKDSARFIDEMIKSRRGGLSSGLKYVDKENALNWLGIVPPKGTAPRTQQERIANIIEKFENPTTKIQKIQDAIRLEKAKFDGVLKNLPLSEANKWYDTRKKTLETLLQNNKISLIEYGERVQKLNTLFNGGYVAENRRRDYSGLTALTYEDNVSAAEAAAKKIKIEPRVGFVVVLYFIELLLLSN